MSRKEKEMRQWGGKGNDGVVKDEKMHERLVKTEQQEREGSKTGSEGREKWVESDGEAQKRNQ